MQYIIYGAGDDGKRAMNSLGWHRCAYFYDTHKAGEIVQNRRVLNYEQLREKYDTGHYIIVVASTKYQVEMELFLQMHGMLRYFAYNSLVFSKLWKYQPFYMLYGEQLWMPFSVVLMHYNVKRYSHIAISNINPALPYMIAEVAFHCQDWRVDYIIDETVEPGNDVSYMGIPCRRLADVKDKIDCLLVNASVLDTDIRDLVPEIPTFDLVDCFDIFKFIPAYKHPELKRFKGQHTGQRCFIIGNGPSLRMSDLDKLQQSDEICFGVNSIYKSFSQTIWRPTYYCSVDSDGRYFPEDDIYHYVNRDQCEAFYVDSIHWSRHAHGEFKDRNCLHYDVVNLGSTEHMPQFSDDICLGVRGANTVLYTCIQIAAYMGFKQIYLLGADSNFDEFTDNNDNHFVKKYIGDNVYKDMSFDVADDNMPDPVAFQQTVMQAFRKAERYSSAHGFRIYNATRGGKLEVFERVDFESLFH